MMSARCHLLFFLICLLCITPVFSSEPEKIPLPEESAVKTTQFNFGGWMDLLYLSGEVPDERDPYLNVPHMYAFADFSFNQKWRAFMEFRRINAPGVKETTAFERLYIEYRQSMPLKIRIGRFNTPAGLWQNLHWAFTIDSTEKPLIEQRHFFPTESDGIHVLGTKVLGAKEMEYSVYTNYGGENKEKDAKNELGYGFDWNIGLWQRTKTGVFYTQFKDDGMGHDPTPGTREVVLFYNETHLYPGKLLWRSEFLHLNRPEVASIDGFYSKLRFNINHQWYVNLRFDETEDLSAEQGIFSQRAKTITLGFQPKPYFRMRAEYSKQNSSEGNDFNHSSLWFGFRF